LRWLHPDVAASAERSIFAGRITAAWEDLKTPERRAGYDQAMGGRAGQQATRKPKLRRAAKRIRPVVIGARRSPSSPLKRMLWLLLGRQP
jgi:curved DNA-binding protein CbpA